MRSFSIVAACLTFAASATAQSVVFGNNGPFPTPADRRVYLDVVGGTPLVGSNFVAQLYYGADPCSLIEHPAVPNRFRAPTTSVPGTWILGPTRILFGFQPGDTVTLQVRVWDISLFPNFEAAVAGGGNFGVSLPFLYPIPVVGPGVPPSSSAFVMDNFRAFALTSQFPVNQEPTFTGGPDVSAAEDSGPQVFADWATGMNPGAPGEAGQALTFSAFNDNNSLFSEQPAVSSSGTLTFTAAPNASGSALVTVVLQDDAGTVNGGCDTSDPYSFTITVTPVNDPPIAVIDPPAFFQLFPDSSDALFLSINGLDATAILDGSHSVDDSPLQFSWFETDPNDPFALSAVATHAFAVGEHTVTLVVSDVEFTDSESISFEVITLSQSIDLIILVVKESNLEDGSKVALINSLEAATEAFQEGDHEKGVRKLEVFLGKVEDEVAPVDLALAQLLSFAAEALISAVEASGVIP